MASFCPRGGGMPTIEQIQDFRERLSPAGDELSLFAIRALWLTVREINRLRDREGLPQFTLQQVVNSLKTADITQEPQV